MSSQNFEYDFSELTPESTEETKSRPNYRVATCCSNCKHFFYIKNKQRRGWCRLPNPEAKVINKKKGEKFDIQEIEKDWLRTHSTGLCDNHRYRSKYAHIGIVAEWTGKDFAFDGTEEERDV